MNQSQPSIAAAGGGFLNYRTPGAFSRIRKKRVWCVLDEEHFALKCYKSQQDAQKSNSGSSAGKSGASFVTALSNIAMTSSSALSLTSLASSTGAATAAATAAATSSAASITSAVAAAAASPAVPELQINLCGAIINLNSMETNEFVVISDDNKEHYLEADNHDSMISWISSLQNKRDMADRNQMRILMNSMRDATQFTRGNAAHQSRGSRRRISEPSIFYAQNYPHAINMMPPILSMSTTPSNWNRCAAAVLQEDDDDDGGGEGGGGGACAVELEKCGTPTCCQIAEEECCVSCEQQNWRFPESKFPLSQSFTLGHGVGRLNLQNPRHFAGGATATATAPPMDFKRALPHSTTAVCTGTAEKLASSAGATLSTTATTTTTRSTAAQSATSERQSISCASDELDDVFNYDLLLLNDFHVCDSASSSNAPAVTSAPRTTTNDKNDNNDEEERDADFDDEAAAIAATCRQKAKLHSETTNEDETDLESYRQMHKQSLDSGAPMKDDSKSMIDSEAFEARDQLERQSFQKIYDLSLELSNVKQELNNSMRSEEVLRQLIEKKDKTILELDGRCTHLEEMDSLSKDKERTAMADEIVTHRKNEKINQEKIRHFLTENKFLQEEIKRLCQIRQKEKSCAIENSNQIQALEMQIEKWKLDYTFLLQSNISVCNRDGCEDFELNLYGGNRHRNRIIELLHKARMINPALPSYEKIMKMGCHIDSYGFRHSFDNEPLLLHYICRQLHQHYSRQLCVYEENQQHWRNFLKSVHKLNHQNTFLKRLCRTGIPIQYRSEVWRMLLMHKIQDVVQARGPHYYNNLCSQVGESPVAALHRKQISLDLMRTLPINIHFNDLEADGVKKLQEVLQSFCIHNAKIGYCQGMNFIAGMSLIFLDKEDAFWCLVAITEKYFQPHYFDENLIGAQADQMVLKQIIREQLPSFSEHLINLDIDISTITLNWFLSIFFDALPFDTLIRVWDCFLLEGPKVLFRFAIAVLKIHQTTIMQQPDTISLWKHLKLAARMTFDVEGLIKVAFEELQLFPKRKKIAEYQKNSVENLKKTIINRKLKRTAFQNFDETNLDLKTNSAPVIERIVCFNRDKLWLCYGEQSSARISQIDCSKCLMTDLDIEFDSRILSIVSISQNLILLGFLSTSLYAFNPQTNEKLWQIRLHDSILDLKLHLCEGEGSGSITSTNKIFASLSDGTIAVIENVTESEPTGNIFYIPISNCTVSALLLLENDLWCASSNAIHILNANTLDRKKFFQISGNPFDHILSIQESDRGVWISVKGSSIIQLWDKLAFTCLFMFDIRKGEKMTPCIREELSSSNSDAAPKHHVMPRQQTLPLDYDHEHNLKLNVHRITAFLSVATMIWIGTGGGDLFVYEVGNANDSYSSSGTHINQTGDTETLQKVAEPESTSSDTAANNKLETIQENKHWQHRVHRAQTFANDDACHGAVNSVENDEKAASSEANLFEMTMIVKNRISETPIRCLSFAHEASEPCIISCSSHYKEDEAVLKWTQKNNDTKIWTNEPIYPLCQQTQQVHYPSYMKHRLSINSN